ncbi:hypothetical protein J6590_060734 [Homalodisca vitripennis]|nr:hypothetical protein J6590_060734 [Homalodisca vitripennis]
MLPRSNLTETVRAWWEFDANYKITASRLQGEIKGLQHRINTTKLRLLNEIKVESLRLQMVSLQNAAWLARPRPSPLRVISTNKQQAEIDVRQLRQHLSTSKHGSKASSAVTTPLPGYSYTPLSSMPSL